ncbi:MAG: response regulator transcription factor [Saprospiraceae bacterium]|nr:response regulator transcription factor [Saprospiraceae bacterium]
MNGQSIIQEHLAQKYGTYEGSLCIESILHKYLHFPNEAVYIIDCQRAQLEPLTPNFNRITGIDRTHQNELTPLYEHIGGDFNEVLQFVHSVIKCGFDAGLDAALENDYTMCLYQTSDERVIMKYTTILERDTNGLMRYSLGKLTDVTGLIPFKRFVYQFLGPSSTRVQLRFNQIQGYESVLSNREREILDYIGKGWSSYQISQHLYISRLTVDKHCRNMITKMNVKNTQEALYIARNHGEI